MGLSQRRRANRKSATMPNNSSLEDCQSSHRHQDDAKKRLGHTYRKVRKAEATERKYTNLLAFEVNRIWNNGLLPAEQPTHPEIKASPNPNLYNRSMISLMECDYTHGLCYSLNKKHRWDFTKQLMEHYDTKEELKTQNVFFTEAVARGRKGPSVRKLVTNATYTVEAANELRKHKKELKRNTERQTKKQKEINSKLRTQLKQQVLENDRFEFSDRVKSSQTERPLVTVESSTRGGSVNTASIKRSCNLWNHLYNVSPNAEESRMALQRDYEARMSICVGTCVPCPDVDVKRCTQSEKYTKNAKRDDPKRPTPRKRERMLQKRRRFEMEVQLDMDGCGAPSETPVVSEAEEDLDEWVSAPADVWNLFDFARPRVLANRDKKLAAKEHKIRQQQQLEKKRKQRSDSDWTSGGSSGYDSGSEESEDKLKVQEPREEDQANARLAESVEAALAAHRPTMEVARGVAESTRISELFADASVSNALVISASTPRKLAVMLSSDLTETVVFEDISDPESDGSRFAVHHLCCNDAAARTSASEVASQADPFDFLVRLAAASLTSVGVAPVGSDKTSTFDAPIAGWKRATALPEYEARLAAIRALPMFSKVPDCGIDAELVPAPDCEICCQQLVSDAVGNFAEGATMLSECGHRFCNQCWLRHVAGSVVAGRADVSCPGFRCKTALDAATLLWFCPAQLVSALTSAAFRLWLADRGDKRQRRLCPRANCSRVLECRAGVNALCECNSVGLCVGCGQEPHWPSDCATASKYRSKMKFFGHEKLSLGDLTAETNVNAKQCPTCFLIMEKGIGCNHMSCPCGEHFCWWCGQPMRAHSGGPCYNSKQPKSDFRVQKVFTAQDSFLVPNSSQSRIYCEAVRVRLSRGYSKTSVRLSSKAVNQLSELFASYMIRFEKAGGSAATRRARDCADRLARATTHASYLVEYSYVHLDNNRVDRRTRTAVRALGGHVVQLVDSLTAEAKERCRRGYCGPKETKLAYEKLLMMLSCLESKCRLMYCIVANQRSRGDSTPRGSKIFG